MKVLLAPDKFKGSLTAAQVVHHLGTGWSSAASPSAGCRSPTAGTAASPPPIAAGFRPVEVTVAAATGERHSATIAFDGTTAVVEVANTCGLHTLPAGALAPLTASSAGVGDAIRAALALGASRIVLALGGSASTDGGAGMLAALGAVFRDETGRQLTVDGGSLRRIHQVDTSRLPDLSQIEIVIASDVQNPLTGPDGAAAVYGPQKGADPGAGAALDGGLAHLVDYLTAGGHPTAGRLAATPGAGAAGGLGFAGMLLGGRAVSGADYFLDLLRLRDPPRGLRPRHHRRGPDRRPDPARQTARDRRPPGRIRSRSSPWSGRSDLSAPGPAAMGLNAVHAIVDHTDGDPARRPRPHRAAARGARPEHSAADLSAADPHQPRRRSPSGPTQPVRRLHRDGKGCVVGAVGPPR